MHRTRKDDGFTLIELLVVVVILGILASVVAFIVTGLPQRGEDAATAADLKTLRHAEEAFYASRQAPATKEYVTEAELVSGGLLTRESSLHDICLKADRQAYEVVTTGTDCSTVAFP